VIALPYENLLEDPRPWHLRAPKHPVESAWHVRPERRAAAAGYVSMSNTAQNLRRNYTSLESAAFIGLEFWIFEF
jgi:hypothetical protein